MPWTSSTIQKHNRALHGEKADHAARIANAVLKSSGNEGTALAVASKWAKQHRRAAGGSAPKAPTYETAAPNVNAQGFVAVPHTSGWDLDLTTGAMTAGARGALQNMAQRGMTIQGAQPASSGAAATQTASSGDTTAGNTATQFSVSGVPGTPGVAPANQAQMEAWLQQQAYQRDQQGSTVSEGGGGGMRQGGRAEGDAEEAHPAGLVIGMGGGRQDNIPINLAPHSHVIPAMVVAGLGQGSPRQGAINLEHMLKGGPFGVAIPKAPSRTPRAVGVIPAPRMAQGGGMKRGGMHTLVSPDEYIWPPADVHRIGAGDYEKGHNFLDRCIVEWKRQIIAMERKQPGPVR